MVRILFLLSAIGFIGSLLVHFGSIFAFKVVATNYSFLLHLGIFVVFTPFIIYLNNGKTMYNFMAAFTKIVPLKYVVVCALLFFYVFVNFIIFMAKSKGGVPDIWKGEFVLQNHGKLIKHITESEYQAFKMNEFRGFSGHWLFFYFMPMVFFYYKIKSLTNR